VGCDEQNPPFRMDETSDFSMEFMKESQLSQLLGGDWNMTNLFSISYMGYIILPIDELHHFSRWAHCTTNQIYWDRMT
jgi:hypothetical protein